MDLQLEAYLAAIEHGFARHLGREHVLSPPDFQLARAWHQAGLPLATLLAGVDAAFAAGFEPRSLAACRRFVEAAPSPARRGSSARAAAPRDPLVALLERLERLAAEGQAAFAACAAEGRALLAADGDVDLARRRVELRERVAVAARAALEPAAEHAERRQAERALGRQASLAPAERAAALERHLTRRALERLGLLALL